MAKSNKNLHLTLSERQIIQRGIENGSTKTSIAATLGKDKSTIGKEIKAHRKHSHICSFDPACANKDRCKHHHVCKNCADLVVFKCKRRDRSPWPAMAVLNTSTADLISSHILQISPIRNIWLTSLTQEKE
ncbi:helix-turn-helix domain-containing protein [Catenibacterium mitsuokai]|uniref:helix-turn-helix domain-containing protein n=1 Tax=Catenibacterium mitsuokai TaxID=100886 RepID=UPI0022004A4D|nr:helix-turn-helix domain-containing protein [Catenibacterium mitsuokai]UWO53124.1 helix-turn-helix domain-containing protein [Catenibacterium mitsuokai]